MKEEIKLIANGDELQANYEYYEFILPAYNCEIDVVLTCKQP